MKLLLLMEKFIALIGSVKGGKVSVKLYKCDHIGWSKNRGNLLIIIILMIYFFILSVIYEIWRRSGCSGKLYAY